MDWNRKVGAFCWFVSAVLFLILLGKMFPEQTGTLRIPGETKIKEWFCNYVIYPVLSAELGQVFPVTDERNRLGEANKDFAGLWADSFLHRLYPITGMAEEHEGTDLADWGKLELSLREWGDSGGGEKEDAGGTSDESPEGQTGAEEPLTQQEVTQVEPSTQENQSEDEEVFLRLPQISGRVYTAEELADVGLTKSFYVIDSSARVYDSDFDGEKLMNLDLTMKQDNSKPQILIYHTHSQEAFADSKDGDAKTSIVGVGDYLTELLERYGYQVIHLKGTYDVEDGIVDRTNAYENAYVDLVRVLDENPSIEVILDVHRDGVADDVRLVTEVGGKPTAKLMFFNGMSRLEGLSSDEYMENPYLEENLAMSLQMKCIGMAYFPDLTRPIFIRGYNYNMDLRAKSMLIEVGAQTNTFEEARNAMEPLAAMLHELLQ